MVRIRIFIAALILFIVSCETHKKEIEGFSFLGKEDINFIYNTLSLKGDQLSYSTWDTTVCLYDIKQKSVLFEKKLEDIGYARPIVSLDQQKIFTTVASDKLSCIRIDDGKPIWETQLSGKCRKFELIDQKIILASIANKGIILLDSKTGEIVRRHNYNYSTCNLPDLSPWESSADSSQYFVSNWECKGITAFDIKTGNINWTYGDHKDGYYGRSLLIGDYLFSGSNNNYKGGRIVLIDRSNGELIFQKDIHFEERCHPILYKNKVIFATYDGRLNSLDLDNHTLETLYQSDKKSTPTDGQIYLAGDSLFYSDSNFQLNCLNLKTNQVEKISSLKRSLQGLFKGEDKIYIFE